MITDELKKGGFEILNDGIKTLWTPDEEAIEQCIDFGKKIVEALD